MKPWPQLSPAEKTTLFAAMFPSPHLDLPLGLTLGHLMDFAERDCASITFSCNGRDAHGGWSCVIFTSAGRDFYARSTSIEDALAQALLKSKGVEAEIFK